MTHAAFARSIPRSATAGLLTVATAAATPIAADESDLAYPGQTGRLVYATQADGDRIMDFSRVGYRYGEVEIPDVAGVKIGRAHV